MRLKLASTSGSRCSARRYRDFAIPPGTMDDLAASGPLRYCLSRARVQGKLRERKRRQEPTPPIFGLTAREVCARRSANKPNGFL